MIGTEQIEVYKYTKVANGFAGYTPGTPLIQSDAPGFATIENTSGNDIETSRRKATESLFTVTVNATYNSFKWNDTFFITSRFGNLDIIGIYESKRKRTYTLTCVLIEGVTGGGSSQIMTVYKNATYGDTSMTIPELDGNEVLLAFRDGIGKQVVENTPTVPEQMKIDNDTFTLYTGDIFGNNELVTVLYRTGLVV